MDSSKKDEMEAASLLKVSRLLTEAKLVKNGRF